MGVVSKGKSKATVELRPETLALIDRNVRLYQGTRSRGAVIDALASSVLGIDTSAAADVYGFCMQSYLDAEEQARASDPIKAQALRNKALGFRGLAKALSTALVDDFEDSEKGGNMSFKKVNPMPFSAVRLDGGVVMPVPRGSVILNDEKEGEAAVAWCVWAYDTSNPCALDGAVRGKCEGPAMVYLSDRDDLYKFGQHKPAAFAGPEDAEDCKAQTMELQELAVSYLSGISALGDGTYQLAWANLMCLRDEGPTLEIGTSFPFGKAESE